MATCDQLAVLDAIVKLGSFNAAAKALNRVQSAVSYSIKTLERDLGVALFSRDGYRPQLTPAGQAIHRKAGVVLTELHELKALAEQLRQGQEPLIRLDISPICPTHLVTPVLQTIADEFPHTQLKISMEIFGGDTLVLNDEVDMSLTDQMAPNPALEWQHAITIPMVAVVASQHPLAMGERTPAKQDMKHHFQVVVRSQSPHLAAKSFGIMAGHMTWRVNDFATKRQLLLDGLGWGHLPRTMIRDDLAAGRLVTLALNFLPKHTAKLKLVRKRGDSHGPVATRLWQRLREAFGKPEFESPAR